MPGLVSLIGVGPGDPGLLTLRGQRAIARADTVLYDALIHPAVLSHARPDAERLWVGKRKGHDSPSQDEINHMLLLRAGQGRFVARLKGGDPLLFGRGAEEAEFLAQHGVAFEIVPGVTAALGASAYAGIPLSHRDLSSSVAFVTSTERTGKGGSAHDWTHLATATQTLVFYMGVHHLADDLATLVRHGRAAETPAAVIQWGTHPEQRVVTGTVGDLAARCAEAGIGAPALVIVGDVVSLRDSLRWWDRGPLFGRTVVITRAATQGDSMRGALLDEGAAPMDVPMLRFEAPSDPSVLDAALDRLCARGYDVAAFTSANGVERTFMALRAKGRDARAFGGAAVVAIGPATAASLVERGITPDAVAKEFIGESVAASIAALRGDAMAGTRVLLARAEVARDALPAALRAMGATVDVAPAYRTVAPSGDVVAPLREALAAGRVDAVTLTSSSTATHLCDALGADAPELLSHTAVASIGPVTSDTARARGLRVTIEARTYTVPGLLDALREHFARTSTP